MEVIAVTKLSMIGVSVLMKSADWFLKQYKRRLFLTPLGFQLILLSRKKRLFHILRIHLLNEGYNS